MTKSILVTTDLSPESESAIEEAVRLGAALKAPVTLLHVLDFTDLWPTNALVLAPSQDMKLRKEIMDRVSDKLDELIELKGRPGVQLNKATVEGQGAAATICTYAEEQGFDMIVIATHGRTGVAHLMIGSVAERVVRQAKCSVLTVRVKQAEA